jgi:cytochrome c biogenesis protein CcmG/thiol:disulfide interchange protein DsbE
MLKRLYMPILATLGGAALIALLIFGVLALGSNRTLDEALAAGHPPLAPAADRQLPYLDEAATTSLARFRGHVVLLNFWASWCVPCQQEAPLLAQAQRELARYGGTVLGVSYKDTRSDATSFMREHHLDFPDLRDRNGSFAEAYGTAALPESFLIDPAGRIVAISRGEIESAFVAHAVALARRAAEATHPRGSAR